MTEEEQSIDLKELHKIEEHNRQDINDLMTVVMGPPPARQNGLRADLKKAFEKIGNLKDYVEKLWTKERPEQCIGAKALEDYKKEIEPIITKFDAHIVQESADKSQKEVAQLNLKGVYFVAISTLIVSLIQILLDFIKK